MIAIDTNLLVYAHREDSEWHEKSVSAVNGLASSGRPWAIAWSSIHEFLAIVTHPRIYSPPTPQEVAFKAIEGWQNSSTLRFLHEGPGYLERLGKLCVHAKISGGRVHDARIAALCLNHGVAELWTADRDFSKFPELKTHNPLVT
ncbi:MAG: PIN domain-containing protein [Verrucomicrobiaceae bacterium]|mgnify:CR=1 FL=1|jgi:toxin-antitoxin system PIN domain toxin|nr:PIN domain-containing protein [Verrucomicrobiales bacterium]MDF1786760.1 PIN domain-containing protein [Verrucomicrobiales bacterium]NCF89499.1 PIN domain-containing protein [Verrucomicrobiaceae bacterium]